MSSGDARVVAPAHDVLVREVDQRARGVVVVAVGDGERERLLEHRAAALVLGAADERGADVGQRVGERLGVADAAGEHRPRACPSAIASRVLLGEHRELRDGR